MSLFQLTTPALLRHQMFILLTLRQLRLPLQLLLRQLQLLLRQLQLLLRQLQLLLRQLQIRHKKTYTVLGRKISLVTPTPNKWWGQELLIDKMQMAL